MFIAFGVNAQPTVSYKTIPELDTAYTAFVLSVRRAFLYDSTVDDYNAILKAEYLETMRKDYASYVILREKYNGLINQLEKNENKINIKIIDSESIHIKPLNFYIEPIEDTIKLNPFEIN